MSAFRDLMSIVDPTAAKTTPAAKSPVPRPASGANGAIQQSPQLKRKASGPVDNNQVKLQRKETAGQPAKPSDNARPIAMPSTSKPKPPALQPTVPYRGTAAPAGTRVASPIVRKPTPQTSTPSTVPKAAPVAKPAPSVAASSASAAPKKGYLALLQKAKEKDAAKPATPPVQNGPTKILTKKERLALKAEASAKGKKPAAGAAARVADAKGDLGKEKKKPVEVGYQGTARPSKPPVQVGYRGTARPASAPASSSRGGTPAAKAKPKPEKGRYDGYADWSDLDDMEDEDDYASDGSSDMEGGIWDVEQEEQLALKAAKKEDAEALAEEMELKRQKEERKRKLLAMSKAAATKKRF